MKSIVILGSTGTIGVNALDVIRTFKHRFKVGGLVAGRNLALLARQVDEFRPRVVSVRDQADVDNLRKLIGRRGVELVHGEEGAVAAATEPTADFVLAAIVGGAGLVPTLAAVRAGKDVGLANKEALVMSGELFVREARKRGVRLLPVDSEHSAVFQCLEGNRRDDVDKIILTASGGPFLRTPLRDLRRVTVEQALQHPTWKMGPKITIDSATMMNKGLEVIEARWLFGVPAERVEVMIHPQSIVHSMVRYRDGAVMAQLGIPDMRIPIAYALSYPERLDTGLAPLNLPKQGELNFLKVESKRYPALDIAYGALDKGGTVPAVLNAANEVAVAAFLEGQVGFRQVHEVSRKTIAAHESTRPRNLRQILETDRWARGFARDLVQRNGRAG
jgi:1-deoxy-D-xylulose-5-phosphate reductoisomerase